MARLAPRASISAVLVRPLAAALVADPKALEAFYASTDLTPQMLADAEARLSPAQFCVAWAETIRLSGDPLLALHLADAMPIGAFGIVEYVCREAPTLREALQQWVHYLVCFGVVARRARAMLPGRFRVAEVRFSHVVSAARRAEYCAFFGCDVTFGALYTEMLIEESVLDAPLPTADANLEAILVPLAAAERGRASPHLPLTDQVRRALRAALTSDDAQLDGVARRLGMTGRSLQRRLKDEGTVFQTIRDEMRRELADHYLGQEMSFAEISFLLGFSEPSAFFRAFKRWTGLTPLERRSRLTSDFAR